MNSKNRSSEVSLSEVNLDKVSFDPHLHSELSDGALISDVAKVARDIGIRIGIADHVRPRRNDVVYYKDDDGSYRITFGSENGVWLSDNIDLITDLVHGERERGCEIVPSLEQDFEKNNSEPVFDFMKEENDLIDFWVLSTHYIDIDRWEKPRYFRHSDFAFLKDKELEQAVDNYFDEYSSKIRFGSKSEHQLGTSVIHSHLDGIMRNEHLRPYVEEDRIEDILDLAVEQDAVIEINGRILRKLREEYSKKENSYEPEDADWFAEEVLDRAERNDLDFTIASDAHSVREMFKNYVGLESVLKNYSVEPLNYAELVSRTEDVSRIQESGIVSNRNSSDVALDRQK